MKKPKKKGMTKKFVTYAASMVCAAIVSGGTAWKVASDLATKRAKGFFAPMASDLIATKSGDMITTKLATKSGNGSNGVDREGLVVVSDVNKTVRAVFTDNATGLTRVVIGGIDMKEVFVDAVEEFSSGKDYNLAVRQLKQQQCIITRLPTAECRK